MHIPWVSELHLFISVLQTHTCTTSILVTSAEQIQWQGTGFYSLFYVVSWSLSLCSHSGATIQMKIKQPTFP